jgi:hypothetical protein
VSSLSACATEQHSAESTPTSVSHFVRRGSGDRESRGFYKNFRDLLSEVQRDLSELSGWPEGWNGYDAARPNPASITHAQAWVTELYRDVSPALWIRPHVVADADGDVVFEWWNGRKKLTVYVTPNTVEYVKVEGPDIASDMEDGTVGVDRARLDLWHWLLD